MNDAVEMRAAARAAEAGTSEPVPSPESHSPESPEPINVEASSPATQIVSSDDDDDINSADMDPNEFVRRIENGEIN